MKLRKLWMLAAIMTISGTVMFTSCTDTPDNPVIPEEPELDAADLTAYTVREIPVNRAGEDGGTVTLRYYEDMPDVPYISVADYHHLMLPGSSFSVTMTGGGQYVLTNANGTATVDTRMETLTSPDHEAFANMMDLAQPGMPNVLYDESPFVRYASIERLTPTQTVAFDYGGYGIDLRGDGSAVYFPLATINDFYTDAEMRHAAFNGEKIVVVADAYHSDIDELDPTYWAPLRKETRSAGMAEFNYRNLCFTLDHYFGYPGRAYLEESMHSAGLDKALQEEGEAGQQTRRLLRSTNTCEFLVGMTLLGNLLDDAGHTRIPLISALCKDAAFKSRYDLVLQAELEQFKTTFPDYGRLTEKDCQFWADRSGHELQRKEKYGAGVYYVKHGNTAVCVFDSFMSYVLDQWRAFYNGSGPRPTIESCPDDDFVILLDALDRAEADPEVENFILDISCNTGGSSDIVVAITSLMTNQSYFHFENTLMNRRSTAWFDIDRNFDGKFDAADRDVKYHLNFAVLESATSFSCGNLLPSLLKDQGVLIMGETSGGGSCCVEMRSTADGYDYRLSSYHGRLFNAAGENIDPGVTPHVAIAPGADITCDINGVPTTFRDFSDYYDIEKLSQIVNDWYGTGQE